MVVEDLGEYHKEEMMTISASITSGQKKQILRFAEDGLDKVGLSKDGAQAVLRQGGKFQDAVMDALRRFSVVFPAWRTVKLGTIPSVEGLRKALGDSGVQISQLAGDILQKVQVAPEETELKLARATVRELGFPNGARYGDICARIKELGHLLCPAEIGPQLRLQHTDQPLGEWLNVAMEPLAVSDGSLYLFAVGRDGGGLWLHTRWSFPDDLWSPDYVFVFVLDESR